MKANVKDLFNLGENSGERERTGALSYEFNGRIRPMERCKGCVWKSENGLYCVWPVCKRRYRVIFDRLSDKGSAQRKS